MEDMRSYFINATKEGVKKHTFIHGGVKYKFPCLYR